MFLKNLRLFLSVFSPLHTVVKRCDDLPDLSPPEFTRSIRVRAVKDAQSPKSKAKQKMKRTVNTKILLDNSTNSSRSSSGSGGNIMLERPYSEEVDRYYN